MPVDKKPQISLPPDLVERVDEFAARQLVRVTRSAAVEALVRIGLETYAGPAKRGRKAAAVEAPVEGGLL